MERTRRRHSYEVKAAAQSDKQTAARPILPRKGEVSPKVTEGEDTEPRLSLTSPSVWQELATSPWRED
ncbi:hypothetical protein C8J40_102331 [Sphingomonas sp. PP-CC-3A-396]|nr:hypothetical protein C8J40_102331 [Sphingomonas sp. PP-CC-3A-396]